MNIILSNLDINTRINLVISKGKNIIYYRSIDDRPRCQYIHQLRDFRKEISEINKELKLNYNNDTYIYYINIFNKILSIIPRKVKSEECFDVILNLNNIL